MHDQRTDNRKTSILDKLKQVFLRRFGGMFKKRIFHAQRCNDAAKSTQH